MQLAQGRPRGTLTVMLALSKRSYGRGISPYPSHPPLILENDQALRNLILAQGRQRAVWSLWRCWR
jgi:hypothetical protein